ncbi:unnamed protein product [Protopolystoma xenopodis]|uniref:GIY-YIG domain-containing protein n=1 Tax=Protopolystoma xenopodis TaxID=117903 RepID=A0A3S5BDK3_9PLAT|nr:unnamed protein product [Protopolystoma xenopodis]
MQHEKADKHDCSGEYRIKCGNCEQKYIGKTGRKIGLQIKEHQRLCRNMDTERSKITEHIAQTGHEIDWKSPCCGRSNVASSHLLFTPTPYLLIG